MANSVDPDQTLHSAASDLGLHYLQRPICPSKAIMVPSFLELSILWELSA